MKVKFSCFLALLMILFLGCGGDKLTEPDEDTLDLTSVEFAPFLNSEVGRQFADAPWDVNNDGKIDIYDLMVVSRHFGEDVEASIQDGTVLEIVNSQRISKTIQVTGIGSALAEPDILVLSLGVSVLKDSVKEAREEAAQAMQGVLDSLKGNGVAEQDLQTQHFSIQQEFDFVNGRREFRGFRVTNTVSATLRDLDQVGQAIDDAAEAGGDVVQVQSIRFAVDNTTALQVQARVGAMRNAHTKARALATEGAVTLGKPISISEVGGSPVVSSFAKGFAEDAAATTPIEAGQLQITVTVNVVYGIE